MNTETLTSSSNDFDANALRKVYGDVATFDTVGPFTLVHLDGPSVEERARRVADFDPDQFFFDDCPLCTKARTEGGHIVYDGTAEPPPAYDFDATKRRLGLAVASAFGGRDPVADPQGPHGQACGSALGLLGDALDAYYGDDDRQRFHALILDAVGMLLGVTEALGTLQPDLHRIDEAAREIRDEATLLAAAE